MERSRQARITGIEGDGGGASWGYGGPEGSSPDPTGTKRGVATACSSNSS